MAFNLPNLPEAPAKPKFLAKKDEKEAYFKRKAVYEKLEKSHKTLSAIRENMGRIRGEIKLDRPQDCNTVERDENGNYVITCPYCLEKFKVCDLLFRAKTREDANGELMECFEPQTDTKYANFWEKMGVNDIESLRGHILDMDPSKGEIYSVTFETNAIGGKETVPYSSEVRERMKKQKVVRLEDRYHIDVTERVCPYCHTQLPGDIGFCPNYIYSFMGNSSCGKTIYINRLILTLTSGKFLDGNIFGIGANDEMAALGETAKDGAKAIFTVTGQSLADATDVGYIPPIILRLQEMETNRKYFITLFDYPGEAIWKDDDAFFQRLAENVRKNSNGLLFMFDSGVTLDHDLPDQYKVIKSKESFDRVDPARATAEQVISRIYATTFNGNAVDKPVALILSKSDLMTVCMDKLIGLIWGNKPNFLIPTPPHQKVMLTEMYKCHKDVTAFLNNKEQSALATARAMCNGNHAWFAVSSTSFPLVNGTIPEGATVSGLHEADPLEWLLYRNGHLAADFGPQNDLAKDAQRWAAAFQVEAYDKLKQLEKDWNGDGFDDATGEINRFNRLLNEYQSI